jgi:hypothetical protein
MGQTRQHLHRIDYPRSLAVLDALLRHRQAAAAGIGYEPSESGAYVDWDRLLRSWLSTSETATIHLTRGIAILEAHGGGLPTSVRPAVAAAFEAISR